MKASEIKEVVCQAIKNPKDSVPLFCWGGPGIGKSSVVRQAAEEEGVECIDIRLVLMDPSDMRGIPVPEDGKARWLPPSFLPHDPDWKGVVFLDELNCCDKGTPVLVITPGERFVKVQPIEQVKVGDKVLSLDLTNWTPCVNLVVERFIRTAPTLIQLEVTNDVKLRVTPEHPLFVEGKGWLPASDIRCGDRLCYLSSVQSKFQEIDQPASTKGASAKHIPVQGQVPRLSLRTKVTQEEEDNQSSCYEAGTRGLLQMWGEVGAVLATVVSGEKSRAQQEGSGDNILSVFPERKVRLGTQSKPGSTREASRPIFTRRTGVSEVLEQSRRQATSFRTSQKDVERCQEESRNCTKYFQSDERRQNSLGEGFSNAHRGRDYPQGIGRDTSARLGVFGEWCISYPSQVKDVEDSRFYWQDAAEGRSSRRLLTQGLGEGEPRLPNGGLSSAEDKCSRTSRPRVDTKEINPISEWVEVVAVNRIDKPVTVYNLHTEPNNNYFAAGVLSHNCAPPLVQNTALQLVLDRKLGEYMLPDGATIIAAGNREMEAFVHRMSPPLLNRFVHVDFEVDNDEWAKWAVQNNIAPQIVGLLTRFRPELIYKFEPQKKSYPTPRSWEFVSKILQNGLPEELKFELIKGCVGEGAAIELRAYQEIYNQLPDLDAILAGKDDTIPQTVDLLYACCVGLVSKAAKPPHYNRLLEYALKLEREYSVFLVKLAYQKNKEAVVKSKKWPEFAKVLVVEDKILS